MKFHLHGSALLKNSFITVDHADACALLDDGLYKTAIDSPNTVLRVEGDEVIITLREGELRYTVLGVHPTRFYGEHMLRLRRVPPGVEVCLPCPDLIP